MMAVKNQLNIFLKETTSNFLASMALKEDKSVSTIVEELVLEAIESREDMAFSILADKRLSDCKKIITHEDVWKRTL